ERELALVFGTAGRQLHHHAMGIDPRPVLPPSVKAEFRAAHTLGDDSNDLALLHRILRHLTERLGSRLRARHLVARRLTVHLAYSDYATAKRSVPIGLAALDVELWNAARRGFALARDRTVALRAVGVSVDRFLEADLQLELWGNSGGRGKREEGNGEAMMAGRDGATAPPPLDPLPDMPARDERPTALQSAVDRIRG